MKHGFLIPIYRHIETAIPLSHKLLKLGFPVILIDDGNGEEAKSLLTKETTNEPNLFLVSLKKNKGKGGAFIAGLKKAFELGLTHVFQIDADGQHDIENVSFFIEKSLEEPSKLICGLPLFDSSAPKSRLNGRKISNFWAVITTLSFKLKDVMCGFRIYPVEETLRITKNPFLDKRMGFDAEFIIRLYWKGVLPLFYPVKINYPMNGISNFRIVRDNLRISFTFTRLCIGMLLRLPLLLCRKIMS